MVVYNTQSKGKIGQLAGLQISALFLFCRMISTPAALHTGPIYTIGATCIEFDSVPFSVGEKRTLDCQHGDEYLKPKKALGKRVRLQGSRKMGCKAHITLRQYVLYPDYSLPKCRAFESKNQERLTKQQQLKQLRADLQSKSSITTAIKYHVSLPTEEAHHAIYPSHPWCTPDGPKNQSNCGTENFRVCGKRYNRTPRNQKGP